MDNRFSTFFHAMLSAIPAEQTISKFEGLCSRVIVVAGFQAENIQEEIAKISKKNAYSFQVKFVYRIKTSTRECLVLFKRAAAK